MSPDAFSGHLALDRDQGNAAARTSAVARQCADGMAKETALAAQPEDRPVPEHSMQHMPYAAHAIRPAVHDRPRFRDLRGPELQATPIRGNPAFKQGFGEIF